MSDILESHAAVAEKVVRQGSPGVTAAADRCASVSEIKARRIFFPALAAFRSNILDAADLSDACRDELKALLEAVDAAAPTTYSWDESMVRRASRQ
jgi:hypothetical protein